MRPAPPKVSPAFGLLGVVAIFLAALTLLFYKSLAPAQAMFANDASLGMLVSQSNTVWSNFLAYWTDLGWIGQNAPSGSPSFNPLFYAIFGPVLYSKFSAPLCLGLLAVSAWYFCRQARLNHWVGILAGLAAALNSNVVSYACWGLPQKAATLAASLFAIGLLLGEAAGWKRWLRVILAGLCVGLGVIEGGDVGAIMSLYVAAFAVWQIVAEPGPMAGNALRGAGRLAVVAVCAGWIASHALSTLIGTQIIGVTGAVQAPKSQEQSWEFATGWSFPPAETLRIVVPGLYGYRMDSPNGGAYWGGVGQDGTPASRFSGSGEYAGIGVVLIAAFAAASACRRDKSPFSPSERKYVWFWIVVAVVSLLVSYGKFAPFYRFIFALPYFSTIRIPMKYLHGMSLALWILFAYGLEALARTGLAKDRTPRAGLGDQLRAWGKSASAFEHRWVMGTLVALGLAVVAAGLYASRAPQLTRYLGTIFPAGTSDPATAQFSIAEAWLAVSFLAATVVMVTLSVAGCFGGSKAGRAWVLLGVILVADLVRANAPWVIHYDYQMRYQTDAVLDVLRQQPYEHRVTSYLSPQRAMPLVQANEFVYLQKEWLENQFQYFNIQSLDIDQMPRKPELDAAYMQTFDLAMGNPANLQKLMVALAYGSMLDQLQPKDALQVKEAIAAAKEPAQTLERLWQLTNTRYLIASPQMANALNDYLDPVRRRFRVVLPFTLGLKPGAPQPTAQSGLGDVVQFLQAVRSEQGTLALIEFGGALPRAKLYTGWQTITNDAASLARLSSAEFDPEKSVVLATEPADVKPSTEATPGDATITSYQSKDIVLKTKSSTAGVLLLNDRWHPDWQVTVDGQPSPLLRANFIMRGVAVPAGEHTVEFRFNPPHGTLWVSVSAIAAGLVCIGLLAFGSKEKPVKA